MTAVSNGTALLSANSHGIAVSRDYGASWIDSNITSTAPITKLFYSDILNKYYAISNKGVYTSNGLLIDWVKMRGTENVTAIRDIIQHPNGDLFLSTDIGVYRRRADQPTFGWQQTPLFGPRSTQSYALLYDEFRDRIIVSNDLGILETTNLGLSWTFTDEFDDFRPIYDFKVYDNSIFAITDKNLWVRSNDSDVFKFAQKQNLAKIEK